MQRYQWKARIRLPVWITVTNQLTSYRFRDMADYWSSFRLDRGASLTHSLGVNPIYWMGNFGPKKLATSLYRKVQKNFDRLESRV